MYIFSIKFYVKRNNLYKFHKILFKDLEISKAFVIKSSALYVEVFNTKRTLFNNIPWCHIDKEISLNSYKDKKMFYEKINAFLEELMKCKGDLCQLRAKIILKNYFKKDDKNPEIVSNNENLCCHINQSCSTSFLKNIKQHFYFILHTEYDVKNIISAMLRFDELKFDKKSYAIQWKINLFIHIIHLLNVTDVLMLSRNYIENQKLPYKFKIFYFYFLYNFFDQKKNTKMLKTWYQTKTICSINDSENMNLKSYLINQAMINNPLDLESFEIVKRKLWNCEFDEYMINKSKIGSNKMIQDKKLSCSIEFLSREEVFSKQNIDNESFCFGNKKEVLFIGDLDMIINVPQACKLVKLIGKCSERIGRKTFIYFNENLKAGENIIRVCLNHDFIAEEVEILDQEYLLRTIKISQIELKYIKCERNLIKYEFKDKILLSSRENIHFKFYCLENPDNLRINQNVDKFECKLEDDIFIIEKTVDKKIKGCLILEQDIDENIVIIYRLYYEVY